MSGDPRSTFSAFLILIAGAGLGWIYFSKASLTDSIVLGVIGGATIALAKSAFSRREP